MNNQYEFNITGGTIGQVGHIEYHGSSALQNDALLRELQNIQQQLKDTEPTASRLSGELREAIQQQNQPKISQTVKELTTGAIGTVIADVAGAALKRFLGLP